MQVEFHVHRRSRRRQSLARRPRPGERAERIDFKQKLYGQLDELVPPDVIIASSSSGAHHERDPEGGRERVPSAASSAIPSSPPHLIPLVEIVGGAKTSEETIRRDGR